MTQETIQGGNAVEIERTPAQFFFEVGFAASWAEAYIRNGENAPFDLSDALIERAWEIAADSHEDPQEFERYAALANAAVQSPVSAADDAERKAIEAAIKETEYKYFGDYELSEAQIEAVYRLVLTATRYLALLNQSRVPTEERVA